MNWVFEVFDCFFSILKEYISPLGDACILLLTIYTFYRTYVSKKINFLGFSLNSSIWDGFSIGVNIQNWSLSTISVNKIELVINEEIKITIKDFNDPLILEPLKSVKIESERNSEFPFKSSELFDSELKLQIYGFNGKVIESKFKRHTKKPRNIKEYKQLSVVNKTFDGKVVTPNMKYKVYIFENGLLQESFIIMKRGLMEKHLWGFNVIPEEHLESKESLKEFLFSIIDKDKYTIDIVDLEKEF